MSVLSLNEPAGILVRTTLVDFPGRVAGSFFLRGCNLRCPYCYNVGLISNESSAEEFNTVQELFSHLEKRIGILSGLVISGGEPLINPYTPVIIRKAKELGYKVKIDTNGILPEKLLELLNDEVLRPDFIAMDIKTSPDRYSEIMCGKKSPYYGNVSFFEEKLKKSIDILASLPSDQREFRTVLVPALITKDDIENIAALLPSDASWQFAQFRNKNCLNPEYNEIIPYIDSEIQELIALAQSKIPGAALR